MKDTGKRLLLSVTLVILVLLTSRCGREQAAPVSEPTATPVPEQVQVIETATPTSIPPTPEPTATPTEEPEVEITYLLEDFEERLPGVWAFKSDAMGQVSVETNIVHSGQQAARVEWDFSRRPKDDPGFVNYFFHSEMVGSPEMAKVWIHSATTESAPGSVQLWIEDNSGEVFLTQATVEKTGWSQLVFKVSEASANWTSGDGNGNKDLPLRFFGLAVSPGVAEKGSMILDQIEVVTRATSRNALLARVETTAPRNLFWDDTPEIVGKVTNFSDVNVTDVHFNLSIMDTYASRTVWSGTLEIGLVAGVSKAQKSVKVRVPYGMHQVKWALGDRLGIIREGSMEFGLTGARCFKGLSVEQQAYQRRCWPFGGVFWQCSPELGSDAGARWIRNWVDWNQFESSREAYNTEKIQQRLKMYLDSGIESLWLLCTTDKTGFYDMEKQDFSRAYGNAWTQIARATQNQLNWFELGNEDNGPQRFLYTEIARHGAAGIRSQNPNALIANSGTAFVDLVWLRLQADRDLFRWLDAVCVHPYTCSSSPHEWKVFDEAKQVQAFIDEVGGMKSAWTTEFGWHHDFDQKKRADWTVQHLLMGVAGGYQKHGLFSWAGHFGIFGDEGPKLPALSTHTLMRMLEGHRFAGVLEQDDEKWVVVWERLGKPLFMAWSPKGSFKLKVPVGEEKVKLYDCFGNPLATSVSEGWLWMNLGTGIQYLVGVPGEMVNFAWESQIRSIHNRFTNHLKTTTLAEDPLLRNIADQPGPKPLEIWQALEHVSDATVEISKTQKTALQANMLRLLTQQARMGLARSFVESVTCEIGDFAPWARALLEQAHSEDVDVPALRWLLNEFEDLDAERRFAESENESDFASRLRTAQVMLAAFGKKYLSDASAYELVSVWSYLLAESEGDTLQERLRFTLGGTTPVQMRINSYAQRDYTASVAIQPPEGWRVSPSSFDVPIQAGADALVTFQVSCPDQVVGHHPVFHAILRIQDKPEVWVKFDDVEVVPPVRILQVPLEGLLPQTPLVLGVYNEDVKSHTGQLALSLKEADQILAVTEFENLAPQSQANLVLSLTDTVQPLPFQDWPLVANLVLADGKSIRQEFSASFLCAVPCPQPPTVDGDLSEWQVAAAFHLDREEFSNGTFVGRWTPDDLSASVYLMWDKNNLYVGARVKDQTFNQNYSGESVWMQDSIQLALAPGLDGPTYEFGLALTPTGEQIVQWLPDIKQVTKGTLKVLLESGQQTYEAAIPWSAMPKIGPVKEGIRLRYSLLVNDDDVLVGRRYLESPGGGIAHDKSLENFMEIVLLGQ